MSFYHHNRTYIVQLRRTIRVPLDRMYRAWQDPEERKYWFAQSSIVEPIEGGLLQSDNGATAEFVEANPMERWRLNWKNPNHKPGSTIVIEFIKNNRYECVIHVRHWKIKARKDYDEIHAGWKCLLDNLESYLEEGESNAYFQWVQQSIPRA